jgi:hypothetical protein
MRMTSHPLSRAAPCRPPSTESVIAEAQSVAGSSIPGAAQLAADEITLMAASMAERSKSQPTIITLRRPIQYGPFSVQ